MIPRWVGVAVVGLVGCQASAPVSDASTSVASTTPTCVELASSAAETSTQEAVRGGPVEVIATYPHQTDAYTEGLVWADGVLYESTGEYGKSELRRVALETGAIEASVGLRAHEYGEGLALVDNRLIQLTWKSGVGHVYDRATFATLGTFSYPGQGWGLAYDGQRLIMSDGTAELRLLDPTTYAETGRLTVTDDGTPVRCLNELEFVDGYIYANVWLTPDIVIIDPSTGQVLMRLDTSALRPPPTLGDKDAVANGIAYDPIGDRLFVTGKRWSTLYEIRRPAV
jgi:glutaminyl-peptide cyclotransferase